MADVRAGSEQVQGQVASGSAVVGNPVLVGGSDGTNARSLKADTDGTLNQDLTKINGSTLALGQTTMSASVPITLASDQTAVPVKKGTIAVSTGAWTSATAQNTAVTLTSLGGYGTVTVEFWETDSGTAVLNAGVLTFEIDGGSSQWFAVTGVRSGTYTAENSYTVTGGKQLWTFDIGGATSFRVRLSTVLGQGAGTGTATGNLRVQASAIEGEPTIIVGQTTASNLKVDLSGTAANSTAVKVDNSAVTQPASQSGTWTVQPGNTVNTSAWLVTPRPGASGGLLAYSFLSTAAVQAANIKNSAGQVYGLHFFNNSATIAYVRLYNQTASPGTGDTANILWRGMIPANTSGAGHVIPIPDGLAFSTGVGIRVSAAIADNDGTALAANVVIGNVLYF